MFFRLVRGVSSPSRSALRWVRNNERKRSGREGGKKVSVCDVIGKRTDIEKKAGNSQVKEERVKEKAEKRERMRERE